MPKLVAALRLSWAVCIQNSRTISAVKKFLAYEVRPRKDKRGFDLISDRLAIRSPVVCRAQRDQQRNQLRKVFQPVHMML